MSISRVKTWSDGQVLTAGDLNAEFDNILNNATNLISPLTGTLNAGFNRITNLRLDAVASYTIATTLNTARIAYHSGEGVVVISQGTTGPFIPLGPQTNQPTRVSGLIGSMISNVGSFQALGYSMKTTTGLMFGVSATSSFSVNTQTAGPTANGRDQVGAFASTTVHYYAIATGVGSTAPQGVVSSVAPPTGPTLPTGYTGWCYLGSGIYTVATSVMTRSHLIVGNQVQVPNVSVVAAGTATSATEASCGSFVPTLAKNIYLQFGPCSVTATVGGSRNAEHTIRNNGAANVVFGLSNIGGGSNEEMQLTVPLMVPNLDTTPAIWYDTDVAALGGQSPSVTILGRGYILPNGDV